MSANRILSSNSPSDLVHVRFNRSEQQSLLRLYLRGDLRNRRLCVDYLRAGLGVRGNRQFILRMCDRMIPDRSTYVRWQALLMLGQHAERHPDEIWPSVLKWGTVQNRDIRRGVACCVLEHVLEHHFDPYFERALSHIAADIGDSHIRLHTVGDSAKRDCRTTLNDSIRSNVRRSREVWHRSNGMLGSDGFRAF